MSYKEYEELLHMVAYGEVTVAQALAILDADQLQAVDVAEETGRLRYIAETLR